jgi:uncharacterized protein
VSILFFPVRDSPALALAEPPRTVGIEIKAAASVKATDFNGLRKLAVASKSFKLGVVLYDGEHTLPFGDHLYAAPISSLWGT